MAKKLALAFIAGVCLPVFVALYLGGETLTQAGLRLTAVEQGFALACRHWQFEATPEHTPEQVAIVDTVPKAKARKR